MESPAVWSAPSTPAFINSSATEPIFLFSFDHLRSPVFTFSLPENRRSPSVCCERFHSSINIGGVGGGGFREKREERAGSLITHAKGF